MKKINLLITCSNHVLHSSFLFSAKRDGRILVSGLKSGKLRRLPIFPWFRVLPFYAFGSSTVFPLDLEKVSFPKGRRRFCFPTFGLSTFFLRKKCHRLVRNRFVGLSGSMVALDFFKFLACFSTFHYLYAKTALFGWRVLKFLPKRFRRVFTPRFLTVGFLSIKDLSRMAYVGAISYYHSFVFFIGTASNLTFYLIKALLTSKVKSSSYMSLPFFKKKIQRSMFKKKGALPLISSPAFKTFKKKNAAIR